MSPEQARGEHLDKRTDVWAFGVTLYEALVGRRPFGGEKTSELLASVLRDEPLYDALPPDTPTAVRRLLRRCLEKDPERRLRDLGDARLELADALAVDRDFKPPKRSGAGRGSRNLLLALAAGLAGLLVGLLGADFFQRDTEGRSNQDVFEQVSLSAPLPRSTSQAYFRSVSLSPDGLRVAVAGRNGRASGIWVKDSRDQDFRHLPGTEGGTAPSISPDGRSVAYVDDATHQLRVLGFDGSGSQTLFEEGLDFHPYWLDDDSLIVQTDIRIARVNGRNESEVLYECPDGSRCLQFGSFDVLDSLEVAELRFERGAFLACEVMGGGTATRISLFRDGQPSKTVVENACFPRVRGDHLYFTRDGELWASSTGNS